MIKIFYSLEEAEKYADKNYFKDTYKIEETKNGNFKIIQNLNNLTCEELIQKISAYKSTCSQYRTTIQRLKGDLRIIKKQLFLISNNINVKYNGKVTYTKGGR